MICETYETGTLQQYKYVVVLSRYKGRLLMSRHKQRTTWESQGGHIEPGETPLEAARRELYEESGALKYVIAPLCDYWAGEKENGQGAGGMVFTADIEELGPMPESEMAEVREFESLPENLTYPAISPVLYEKLTAVSGRCEKSDDGLPEKLPGKRKLRHGTMMPNSGELRNSKKLSGGTELRNRTKLLYGTGNPAKLEGMKRWLKPLDIELVGLQDMKGEMPSVEENGTTPLENAEKKAIAYYQAFRMPVFSCDSGLYIDGIPQEEQPGIHVRTVNGRYLSDEEMLEHYSGLARKYGDLTARYRNAICLVLDEEHIYRAMDKSMESAPFIITSRPHSAIRKKGFPLDSLSVDIRTGKYYYDLEEKELDQVATGEGFLDFFRRLKE